MALKMKEGPWITTKDMFEIIVSEMKKIPDFEKYGDIIEYISPTSKDQFVYNIDELYPTVIATVSPGCCEGIFLDILLEYHNGIFGRTNRYPLGCIKTLSESTHGYIAMGAMGGFLTELAYRFLYENSNQLKERAQFGFLAPKDDQDEDRLLRAKRKLLDFERNGIYHFFEEKVEGGILFYGDVSPKQLGCNIFLQPYYKVEEDKAGFSKIKPVISIDRPVDKVVERFTGYPVKLRFFKDRYEARDYIEFCQKRS